MAQRDRPSHAFLVRDAHRKALTWHFIALAAGLLGLFGLNRFLTPQVFWAHWVALAWAVIFLVHLAFFARGTLESMGAWRAKRRSAESLRAEAREDALPKITDAQG
jgi:hypothetical protein